MDLAGTEVEPGAAAGARHGTGRRPALLLRAVHCRAGTTGGSCRRGPGPLPLYGRWAGGDRDGGEDVLGRGTRHAYVAPVQAGLRVEGVAGGRLREARVGPAGHLPPLRPLLQGPLV